MLLLGGTEGRDRTGTSVTSLVFETNASTYSATSAWYGWLRQAQPTLTNSANLIELVGIRRQKYTFF